MTTTEYEYALDLRIADEALLREIRTGHAVGIVVDATYRLHPSGELGR